MDYEKLYKEANKKVAVRFGSNVAKELFPDLYESEDERIIERIKKAVESYWSDEPLDEILAWLEKHADKVEPKFKVGDKVLVDGKVYTIKLVNEDNYIVDENGRDVQEHFSYTKDWKLYEQKPTAWSEEDETALGDALWCCKQAASIAKNENDMGNVWYAETWLKAIKDRVQPKQEWSEDDERKLNAICSLVYSNPAQDPFYAKISLENWLKSLKERYTWRPSDEQMDALHYVTNFDYGGHKATLVSLYEQLKKLKG